MRDYYGRAFDPQRYFETLALNLIMRCVGLVIRLATIFIGLVFEIGVLMLGAVAFVIWIFLPLIVFSCFFKGISLIL